jgi:flagellar basal-body rod protein FlgG
MQSIYTAASGLNSQQTRLDTIAANIANSSTPGYKSTRVDFKDALYTTMENPAGADEAVNLEAGTGVVIGATTTDFTDGALIATGQPLDFAITGDGFFTVQNENGETLYTRNGSFASTPMDGQNYLVTAQGYFVLDSEGNRITIPDGVSNFSVTSAGIFNTADGDTGRLGLTSFSNPDGLDGVGNSCFRATAVSGEPEEAVNVAVVQGSVEGSNVNLASEMTMLIRSQRAFSLASRALQTADDMEGLANNMH